MMETRTSWAAPGGFAQQNFLQSCTELWGLHGVLWVCHTHIFKCLEHNGYFCKELKMRKLWSLPWFVQAPVLVGDQHLPPLPTPVPTNPGRWKR